MPSTPREPAAEIVGREPELETLREFVSPARRARALVLAGGPGIGKTTLWQAGIGLARASGMHVLAARPSGAESELGFAALADLCDAIDDSALAALPAPQRAALEIALLRAEPASAPPEPRAIAVGLLNAVRALAAEAPVLIAIDDAQWLDAPSADALAFAVRRLRDERVALLLAKRPVPPTPLERALDRGELVRLDVGSLGLSSTRRLLAERLGLSLPRPLLRRVVDDTLGNPLFALEVGRALAEHGLPAPDEDMPVPDSAEELLGRRVDRVPAAARRALLAVALAGELREHTLEAVVGVAATDEAVRGGLLDVCDGRVRPAHPLLAAAASRRSERRERRALHARLAEALAGEQGAALHLALAAGAPDPRLARELARASDEAAARGDRRRAVRLAEHALRLTPEGSAERHARLLELAAHLDAAGEAQRLTDLLTPAVESMPAGALRARAHLLLSEGAGPRTIPEIERHLDAALAESGHDPGLRAHVLAKRAANAAASWIHALPETERRAEEAHALSAAAGHDVERIALHGLAWARVMNGRAIDDVCERAAAICDGGAYLAEGVERIAAQRLIWRGELAAARVALERLLALADERGEPASYALLRLHLCELELRAGDWAGAQRRLDEWAESAEGDLLIRPMYQRCRALLAAGRGDAGEAARWAGEAIARGEAIVSQWDRLEGLRASGIAALAERDPARAAAGLRLAWAHLCRAQVGDAGVFPIAPELVEALADLGEIAEARAVTDGLAALAERQAHPAGLAAVKRCRGLEAIAEGMTAAGAEALAGAAADYERLGMRFDAARCLLSAGRGQRRTKQWAAARGSLESAVAAFAAIGSGGWAERARSELARVGGRRPRATGELTPTERDVVVLAADGLANKEIARALHVAVHSVEVHLSRVYRKLGVRSRTQLVARLADGALLSS